MKFFRMLLAVLLAGIVGMSVANAQATKLAFTVEPVGGPIGSAFATQPTVEAQDVNGVTDTTYSGPVTVSISTGTAVGGAQLVGQKTVNAINGVAAFTDLRITQPGFYALTATSGTLTPVTMANGFSVTLAITGVYLKQMPTVAVDGINPTTQLSGLAQVRQFVINSNPGSPWKGTIYLPRRHNSGQPGEFGPGTVFYWKGDTVLTAAGPNLKAPTGSFVQDAAVYDMTAGNSCWGIAIGGDDYVYVTGLSTKKVVRYNPDGTNPVLVIPSTAGFSSGGNLRSMFATGKGINTTIWYIDDGKVVAKFVASAVDGNGAPTAFTKTQLFISGDDSSQHYQLVPNSTQDTVYYSAYMGFTSWFSPTKYSVTGTKSTGFPIYTQYTGDSTAIDSQDRVLYAGWSGLKRFAPLNPRNGSNLTDDGAGGINANGYTPDPTEWKYTYTNQTVELSRYSDRHYFFFGCDANSTSGGSTLGVFATNMPAPDAKGVAVANPGTGNSLSISFTQANDPELIGANIYRSTSAGVLGTKVNTTPVASPYSDGGLTSGSTYYYTVRPVGQDPFTNAQYESANVLQVSGIPVLVLPPVAPTAISATDTKLGGEVLVAWTTPALYSDVINIYRSTTAGVLGTKVKVITSPTPSAPATWLDEGLTNGVQVYYTVKAMNGKGEESPNTDQVTATPTDQTPPTFAGITGAKDYGFPGVRVSWGPATDHSAVTFKVYVASSYDGFNLGTPFATTTDLKYDLRGLTLNQTIFVQVKAVDAYGNADTTNRIFDVTPNRVIVDPDINVPANSANVNVQPDAAFPALQQTSIGAGKPSADDLFLTTFLPGTDFFNTNDKLGKVLYTVPINAAGNYDISANWYNGSGLVAPHTRYSVTKPDGTVLPDVFLDETGGVNGNVWNLVTNANLTVGTMTVLVDFTTVTDTSPSNNFYAPAIRAIIPTKPVNIYKTNTAPTIDGNITSGEWLGSQDVLLGKPSQNLLPGFWKGPSDYTAHVYLRWDATNLYIAEQATDNILAWPIKSTTTPQTLFDNDSLEVYLGLDPAADPARVTYGAGDYQFILSAYDDVAPPALTGAWQAVQPDFSLSVPTVAVVKTATGYNMEAAIPWSAFTTFPTAPAADSVIGFNLHGNDNDTPASPGANSIFSLSGLGNSYVNPQAWVKAKIVGTVPPAIVKGDLNGDGLFNATDVKMALQIAAGLTPNTLQSKAAGDVVPAGSPDGKIDLRDAVRLDRALNGKDTL